MFMEPSAAGQLAALNQSYKEMEHIYHWYARRHGLSDAHLWLLYSLYESQAHTQREISSIWHYPPQTVNSALKGLERQGLVLLEEVPGNKSNKRVALSERGAALAREIIRPLICAELRAIQGLGTEETAALVALTEKYTQRLQGELTQQGAQPTHTAGAAGIDRSRNPGKEA